MKRTIRIATRGSALALAQSRAVAAALSGAHDDLEVVLEVISTKGDRVLDVALNKVGDKGLFTAELEDALREGRADIAVHSMKDLPTELPPGLVLGAVCAREDPRDVLITRHELAYDLGLENDGTEGNAAAMLELMPEGMSIGTSSLRRRALVQGWRTDFDVRDLRGNVDTRLKRMGEGKYDGIILALAGIKRLGFWDAKQSDLRVPGLEGQLVAFPLLPDVFVPAACQGAVAIECREDDVATLDLIAPLRDQTTEVACGLERAFLNRIGGGCQVPSGVYASPIEGRMRINAVIASVDGTRTLTAESVAPPASANASVIRLADSLLERGGKEIVEECRRMA